MLHTSAKLALDFALREFYFSAYYNSSSLWQVRVASKLLLNFSCLYLRLWSVRWVIEDKKLHRTSVVPMTTLHLMLMVHYSGAHDMRDHQTWQNILKSFGATNNLPFALASSIQFLISLNCLISCNTRSCLAFDTCKFISKSVEFLVGC